jgi:hypothetical protein
MCELLLGMVQGSILGPLLCAIYVSPLFDTEYLLACANDNYIPILGDNITSVVRHGELSEANNKMATRFKLSSEQE